MPPKDLNQLRPHTYTVYCHDPRDGYCKFDFSDLKFAREGCNALLEKYPTGGYKIIRDDGLVIRRKNYLD